MKLINLDDLLQFSPQGKNINADVMRGIEMVMEYVSGMDYIDTDDVHESLKDEWNDYCYECRGYGDDYYFDENGEIHDRCSECAYNND